MGSEAATVAETGSEAAAEAATGSAAEAAIGSEAAAEAATGSEAAAAAAIGSAAEAAIGSEAAAEAETGSEAAAEAAIGLEAAAEAATGSEAAVTTEEAVAANSSMLEGIRLLAYSCLLTTHRWDLHHTGQTLQVFYNKTSAPASINPTRAATHKVTMLVSAEQVEGTLPLRALFDNSLPFTVSVSDAFKQPFYLHDDSRTKR